MTSAVLDALVRARSGIEVLDRAFRLWTFAFGAAEKEATEPSLDWLDLAEAFEDGEPNLFSLLRWDTRLVETLYGRDDDLKKILDWAESGAKAPGARLITGEGGAGKTRLAAEAAKVLRDRGWTAGFLPRHRNAFNFAVGDKGLFLVLDYPEEQPARTAAILKDLAERKTAPYPLKILFVSRRSFAEWEGETTMLQGRFGRQAIAAPAPLSVEDGARLIAEAAGRLAERMERPRPDLERRAELAGRIAPQPAAALRDHRRDPCGPFADRSVRPDRRRAPEKTRRARTGPRPPDLGVAWSRPNRTRDPARARRARGRLE